MNIGFDLDGTLITCREKHVKCLELALQKLELSIDLDLNEYWQKKQIGNNNFDALVSQFNSKDELKKVCKQWVEDIEKEPIQFHDKLYENVLLTLSKLSKSHTLFLISARSNEANAMTQLIHLKLAGFFTKVSFVNHDNVSVNKQKVMNSFKLDYYIGDTETDFEATKLADVKFIATDYGMRNRNFWLNKAKVISSLEELNEVIN